MAANTATGLSISGSAKDEIFGFESVFAGLGNDVIYGSAAGNTLFGNAGDDFLAGFGGNDSLDGGDGNDVLVGGAGTDQLTGGPGADFFTYTALSDSGITAATRDVITDFSQSDPDKIDLSAIDANTKNAAGTIDPFTFIGTNVPFTGTPGQLHALWNAAGQLVEGDVNGDKKADFSIQLIDPTHAITLTSADFDPPSSAAMTAAVANSAALFASHIASTFVTPSSDHIGTPISEAAQSQHVLLATPHPRDIKPAKLTR